MRRVPITAFAGAALLFASAVGASAAVPVSDLNVREGPGTQYRVIHTLRAGQPIDVGACSAGWCQAAGGWVSRAYLAPMDAGIANPGMRVGVAPRPLAYDPYWYGPPAYYAPRYSYWGPRMGIGAGPLDLELW